MKRYSDTSIIAAYYCPEEGSSAAEKSLRSCRVVISSLCETEMASALSGKVRRGEISFIDARKVFLKFRNDIKMGMYEVMPIDTRHFWLASEFISNHRTTLRTLDALHAAAAYDSGYPLLTFDKALRNACRSLGISSGIV